MISRRLTSITITVALIATVAFVFGQQNLVMAEEKESPYKIANDIAIHTVFEFHQGALETDGFQVFTQISGFDRKRGSAAFTLEGAVDVDREYLYEAADTTFYRGLEDQVHEYTNFDVRVYLHQNGKTLRQFNYEDCRISKYEVETLFDKEEGWFGKGFAVIDKFSVTCNGYQPVNALKDLHKTNGFTEQHTMSSKEYQAIQKAREQ